MAGFRTEKTDLRRVSDRDKDSLTRTGAVSKQRQALKELVLGMVGKRIEQTVPSAQRSLHLALAGEPWYWYSARTL